jgi:thiamine-phosphate pyrophosphorylase
MIRPVLVVITDTTVAEESVLLERLERTLTLARPGTVLVQLRDPALAVRTRLALGERLRALCTRHGHWFGVNDRVDLAVLLGADALHLGERSIAPARARALLPEAFVSHASHAVEGVAVPGSDAAVLSPIVAARKGRPPLGIAALAQARLHAQAAPDETALYALGGIDASNAAACLAAGATGVAVIGAALDGRDVAPLIDALGIARRR